MTRLNHTVRNLIRKHDIMADKLDFVIQYIQRAYEGAERIRQEDTGGGTADDPTPRAQHLQGGPYLGLYLNQSPDLQLQDFEQNLMALDD